jgi:DNA-binding PadR family transcriptional regulator
MTKREILEGLAQKGGFVSPDELRLRLRLKLDRRSVYSYLQRLMRQNLLESRSLGRGSLAYRLTERGRARLEYLRNRTRQ